MSFPSNWNLVEIRGEYLGIDGTPISGRVQFTARASRFVDSEQNTLIIGRTKSAKLDNDGKFSIFLPATDDPDVNPTDFTYQVREDFAGGMTYDIEVPVAAAGTGLEIAALTPVDAVDGVAVIVGPPGPAGSPGATGAQGPPGATTVLANTQTTDYTLVLADAGKAVEINATTNKTVTIPLNVFALGTIIEVCHLGATGQTTVVCPGGTLRIGSSAITRAQNSSLILRQRATNDWVVSGDAQ